LETWMDRGEQGRSLAFMDSGGGGGEEEMEEEEEEKVQIFLNK